VHPPVTAAAGHVYEGDRNIIRPLDTLSTYRSAPEETFNAAEMPMRCSVTQQAGSRKVACTGGMQ